MFFWFLCGLFLLLHLNGGTVTVAERVFNKCVLPAKNVREGVSGEVIFELGHEI